MAKESGKTGMSEERKLYLQQYRRVHFKRVPLDVTPEFMEAIKAAAKAKDMPVSKFLRWLIGMYLKQMGFLKNSEN